MKRFEYQWQDFKWTDCEAPTQSDLLALANEFPIPLQTLEKCLDPEVLPRSEITEEVLCIVLRHHDAQAKPTAKTLQELTTKLVLFVGPNFILSIHRAALACITSHRQNAANERFSTSAFVKNMFFQAIMSFDKPLEELENKTQIIQERVVSLKRRNILREGYLIKRKISSFRKVFKFTSDMINRLPTEIEIAPRDLAQVREPLDKHIFYADDVQEEISGLLNLHLSLMSQKTNEASYRTNEVMRVLTVFSIFFLPLNFIAGVYGMNFENMPELSAPQGYYLTLLAMALVVVLITVWMYKKGWLKKEEL
ncbi:MAG: magnesium and cobalt transport protein [Bdellovibrio sp.]|nr:magnesium and cobalt transport protein [Bdellovibrio sp.]